MTPLEVLLLADDKPGHYHLAEGVIAAVGRLVPVNTTRIEVQRRWVTPGRLLSRLVNNGLSSRRLLRLGYGIRLEDLPFPDLVISAGGNTLAANIAASRAFRADNIFIGSLRRFLPEDFSVVITSYERFSHRPRHLVCLKPCTLNPDTLGHPVSLASCHPKNLPGNTGLLLGGDTPDFKYSSDEWHGLGKIIDQTHQRWGTRWLVSNSRRTPDIASDFFAEKAAQSGSPMEFIDYRVAGPGSLHRIFTTTGLILCTEDSSTMISEAIAARLPVIGLHPKVHGFTPQEQEYRHYLQDNRWTETLAIADVTPETLTRAHHRIHPMRENHLDLLAEKLKQRLPELLS